ncbi:unnamed protein product [Auanema sp. JU1783]|nr:unnamed protein product [Auanema sp. JU1783]
MSAQIGAINSVNALISKVFQQPKGDLADRLNSRITVCILSVSAGLLLSAHFMGEPINCWTPAQFTKDWSTFVNQYCYVHGTYFVPLDQELSFDEEARQRIKITYYQWVPYILALQAFLFYIPRFIWKTMMSGSGYDLAGAIRYVDQFWSSIRNTGDGFKYRIALFESQPSLYIWDGLRLARKKNSEDMALYYIVSTVLQSLNAWIQWFWLNSLLNSPLYSFWGPSVISDLISGQDWQTTGHFPRITHCDFNRRRPAGVQQDTVLCVLTMNIYYEKLFLFLWFWLLFVAVISTSNSLYWVMCLCNPRKMRGTVDNYLQLDGRSKTTREHFYKVLGKDGLFVLHQITLNLGDIPTSYLTIAMRNCCPDMIENSVDCEKQTLLPTEKA